MKQFIRAAVDLGKNYLQFHGLESETGVATTRKLRRSDALQFFSKIAPCRIGMESCGSAHHWARELVALGHEVVLIPPGYVKPYVRRGKNDAADAAAICEAMARPDMRFVPIKTAEQQALLMLHKTRELLIKQRTMSVNALRGHLAEFGLVVARGIGRVEDLIEFARADTRLPAAAHAAVELLASQLGELNARIDTLEGEIAQANASNPTSRLLDTIPGVGPLIASLVAARAPDPAAFRSGRDFSAWLGLTPRQQSSGGKEKLGAITRQGDRSIRTLLIVGATSALRVARKRKGALAEWIVALRARKPEKLVAVALANKLARIAWAMMSTGEVFRAEIYAKA